MILILILVSRLESVVDQTLKCPGDTGIEYATDVRVDLCKQLLIMLYSSVVGCQRIQDG